MFMNTSISVKKKNCRNLLPLIHRIMFITDLDLKLFVIMDKKKKPAFVTSAVFVFFVYRYLNCNFSFDRV